MKIACVNGVSFKNTGIQPQKSSKTVAEQESEAQKLRQSMDKSGISSKPVTIGAIGGLILGAGYTLVKRGSIPDILINAMCMGGLGVIAGKIFNYTQKLTKPENQG